MSKQKKDNFIKQAAILAIVGIICRIIGILYRIPLIKIIGPEGNGYYSSAYNIYSIILLISSYSIPSAISKEISQKLALKEYKNAQKIFHSSLFYVFIIGTLASLFTYFFAGYLVGKNSIIVLQMFAPTIFLFGFLGVFRGYFQAHRTMVQTSVSQILEQLLNALISILTAYYLINTVANSDNTKKAVYGAIGSSIGTGCGVIVALLFMLIVYFYNKDIIKKQVMRDKNIHSESYIEILINIFRNVTPFILSTFIYNLNTSLNQVIYTKVLFNLKKLSEKIIAIQYGNFAGEAVIIANIPIAIASAMSSAIIPSISQIYVQGDIKRTKLKVDIAIRTIMLISIPAAVGIAVLSKPIVYLLFPQRETNLQVSLILKYLSLTTVFYSLSTLTNAVLQGVGKIYLPVINALISLIIQTCVFVPILIYTELNVYCLVIASNIYSFIMCYLNLFAIRKHLDYKHNIKKNFLFPFLSSIGMGALANISYKLLYLMSKSNILSLAFTLIIAIIIYLFLIIKLKCIGIEEFESIPKAKKIINSIQNMKII